MDKPLTFEEYDKHCIDIDEEIFHKLQELIAQKLPKKNTPDTLIYITARIATKSIYLSSPSREVEEKIIDGFCAEIKKLIREVKVVTLN